MSNKTYRIELVTFTAKGKTNHIDDVFITSEAEKDDVVKYYSEKYKPLRVNVTELEVVEIPSEKAPTGETISRKEGSMYSDPEYRIDRESLPKEVQELLTHLDEVDTDISETKKKINGLMFPYFSNGGAMSSYSKDSINCRGYAKPLVLNLNNKEYKK